MSTKLARLPSMVVPEDFKELLREYAFHHKISMSEAVRILVLQSDEIQQIAKKNSVDLATMSVESWGGDRRKYQTAGED